MLKVGDDKHRTGDEYQLAGADYDDREIFRVEGEFVPNHVRFPGIVDIPTGVYRYAVIRTRGGLPEQILGGKLTVIPAVQPTNTQETGA